MSLLLLGEPRLLPSGWPGQAVARHKGAARWDRPTKVLWTTPSQKILRRVHDVNCF